MVQLLLEKGADVNMKTKDNGKQTELHLAAGNSNETRVQLLLEKGADINANDTSGWTALMWAAWRGYETSVRSLVEKGADIDADTKYGTALHAAASKGQAQQQQRAALMDQAQYFKPTGTIPWAFFLRGYDA